MKRAILIARPKHQKRVILLSQNTYCSLNLTSLFSHLSAGRKLGFSIGFYPRASFIYNHESTQTHRKMSLFVVNNFGQWHTEDAHMPFKHLFVLHRFDYLIFSVFHSIQSIKCSTQYTDITQATLFPLNKFR